MLQARVSAARRTPGLLGAYRLWHPPSARPLPPRLLPPPHVAQRRGFVGDFRRVTRLFGDPELPTSDPPRTVPLNDLGAALLAQDPKNRIRFQYPELFEHLRVGTDWARNVHIRTYMPVSTPLPLHNGNGAWWPRGHIADLPSLLCEIPRL